MQNITCAADIKKAIQLLEIEQAMNEQLLKTQFRATYENLRPVNIIRNTIKDFTSEPSLMSNLVGTTVGLATGYLSKKIVVGSSNNIFIKLFGSVVEYGVTSMIARHPETVKAAGHFIANLFAPKKEMNPETEN